jgi:hypothetical protein
MVLLAGLLAVGCTSMKKETQPDQTKKTAAAKPASDQVPAPVAKLLPAEQLDPNNVHAQAQLMEQTLNREKGQTEQTATATAKSE